MIRKLMTTFTLPPPRTLKNIGAGMLAFLGLCVLTAFFAGGIQTIADWKGLVGHKDWDQHTSFLIMVYNSVKAGQFPLWSPYMCGGVPLWADSQVGFLTPLFIPILLFKPFTGIQIVYLLMFIVGGMNMYLLVRSRGVGYVASFIGALYFAFGGSLVLRLWEGHWNFAQIVWVPLVLLFAWKAMEKNWKYAFAAGGVLALMIFSGSNYTPIMACLFLAMYAIVRTVLEHDMRPILIAALVGITMAGVGAMKILPSLEYAKYGNLRTSVAANDEYKLRDFLNGVVTKYRGENAETARDPLPWVQGQPHWEYAGYLGWLPLFGALLFFLTQRKKPHDFAVLFGAITLTLIAMSGSFAYDSPWNILQRLPIFRSQMISGRYFSLVPIFITIYFALAVNDFLSGLAEKIRQRKTGDTKSTWSQRLSFLGLHGMIIIIASGLLFFCMIDLQKATEHYFTVFEEPIATTPIHETFSQYEVKNNTEMVEWYDRDSNMLMSAGATFNFGNTTCYNPSASKLYIFSRTPEYAERIDDPNFYRGEQWLTTEKGSVELLAWTPNAYTVLVESPTATTLILNQNFFPGWRSKEFGEAYPHPGDTPTHQAEREQGVTRTSGHIAIDLPEGKHEVMMEYAPKSFRQGTFITISSLFLIGVVLIQKPLTKKLARVIRQSK